VGGAGASASVAFEEMSSAQVLELIVKPATASAASSYAQLLIAQASAARARRALRWASAREVAAGEADAGCPLRRTLARRTQNARDAADQPQAAFASVFVTHAWASNFCALLDALATCDGAESAYFWIGAQPPQPRRPSRPFLVPRLLNADALWAAQTCSPSTGPPFRAWR
jgi:hypothetical protein